MGKIFLFMNVSLDGFVEDAQKDISAFSLRDSKFEAYQRERGKGTGTILLGRKTFEMMRAFWPTPMAAQMAPDVAAFMNERPKIVISHNNLDPNWQNTTVITNDLVNELGKLRELGDDTIVMGSNDLCKTLIAEGLLDEIQIVVNPVLLSGGTTLFDGLLEMPELRLKETVPFESGKVLLKYEVGEK